jgi:hypothetical protein
MNQKIILALLFFLSTAMAFAQTGNLTIRSDKGEKFYLLINGQLLNQNPQTAILVQNLNEPYFDIEIKFANPRLRNIMMGPLTIADANGQMRHVTYKIAKSKRGKMKLSFVSMVPVDHYAVVPRNVFIAHYYPETIQEPIEAVPNQRIGCRDSYRMGNNDFQSAVATIKSQSFDDTRQKLARQIASSNCMSTDQIIQIANLFGFDQSKLEFTKFAYDFCTDPNNYFKVSNVFGFSSSAEELSDYVDSRK